ncbi:methyl-accepting chemotaxis protein [Shewanella avicenniae]|uniref:Methyl-accepting chemotaxis protein n=1 Tax=Shewanella avicenniae TaxID=2814294 RepID=A0ABX7QSH0_9GAMM|nr:methyl-accepting chemotaxis protein [Shewanella avicenniae]QSX33823.1 methyl-accepting chemotaxis protein [Shewanella avicenniae]
MSFIKLSIKQKFILTMVLAVLLPSIVAGTLGQRSAREVISQRMLNSELPNLLLQIRYRIELEIGGLLQASEQLANDPLLGSWLQRGRPDAEEPLVEQRLQALVSQYDLAQASYADRETAAYYTQNGLLRILTPAQDGWFFRYRNSGQDKMLQLYTEPKSGDVKLFINYQQVNGRALVGLGKSLNDMANLLSRFQIEQSGQVYLVDAEGKVQIHRNNQLVGNSRLQQLYPNSDLSGLLQQQSLAMVHVGSDNDTVLVASSYMPEIGWYLVAEVPEQEIFAALDNASWKIFGLTLSVCALFILLAIWVGGSISKPISAAATMFAELGQGDGDLRKRLPENSRDELGLLARGFNRFVDKIQQSIQNVANTSESLSMAAHMADSHAQQTVLDRQQQHDHAVTVAAAVTEMGATVNEIANNAAYAAEAARAANEDAANGQQVVLRARQVINELSADVGNMAEIINNLSENTDAIGSVLEVIRSISEQTNLLALNAAIEAARAGEAGRGFSVVADEVRGLATRTASSTDEVQQMINTLQREASKAVTAMQQSQQRSKLGVAAADDVTQALQHISKRIAQISDMNMQVAAATEQQSATVHEINHHLTDMSEVSSRSELRANEAAEASQALNQLADSLKQLVGQFKLSDSIALEQTRFNKTNRRK